MSDDFGNPMARFVLVVMMLLSASFPFILMGYGELWSVDSTVVDKTPVEEYEGDYKTFEKHSDHVHHPKQGIIMETIHHNSQTLNPLFADNYNWEGAYLYEGTVYEIEKSNPYFDPPF